MPAMSKTLIILPTLCLTALLTACDQPQSWLPADGKFPDGSRYHGQVIDGLLQGPGRLEYANGSHYEGSFKDGVFDGNGQWWGTAGEHYQGEFVGGLFQGQGVLRQADGSRYEGSFVQGQFSGQGMLEQGTSRYIGEFDKGRYQGLGSLTQADGSRFEGQFVAGQANGDGVRTDAFGDQYIGRFTDGVLSGQGTYRGADGDIYSGEFKDDLFHGAGRYQSADGDVWVGPFVEDTFTGQGEFIGVDGRRYLGHFVDWQFHGLGLLTHPNGSAYQGQFSQGQYDGQGVLTQPDGRRLSGVWQQGRRIRDEHNQRIPDPLDLALLNQGNLLSALLKNIPASTATPELYSLTVAGDGKQSVFMREAKYVAQLMRERFGAHASLSLINHRDHLGDLPMASRENLARTIERLAEQSGPEDLVLLYFTTHGSADHALVLDAPRAPLLDLPATELAELLAPLANRDKVVIISACYSGGFIEPLKDSRTLIMTAARADRVSFGCSEENDFTYFGRALFAEALGETDNLERAFELTKERVAEREAQQGFEASEPQIWAPRNVLQRWQTLRRHQTQQTLGPSPSN